VSRDSSGENRLTTIVRSGACLRAVIPKRWTSSGSRGSATAMRLVTLTVAMSASVPSSKVTVMLIWPSLALADDMYSMSSVPLTCSSIGSVTVRSTTSALAPLKFAET
jgi:hypothetical protein